MERANPDWLLLIRHWVGQGGTGYTLPFLVGARSLKNGMASPTLDDARTLLEEIFSHQFENYTIQLLFCQNLQCLVFGLYPSARGFLGDDHTPSQGKYYSASKSNLHAVLVRNEITERYGNTINELVENIVSDFKEQIADGNFSRSYDKKWSPFPRDQIFRIKDVLGLD